MEIIKRMFLLLFIMITSIVSGQKLSKNEKEAFLIGMFNYYGGCINIPNHPTLDKRLTYFFESDAKLIKIFSDTLKKYSLENNIKFEIVKNGSFTEVYLRDTINPFERYFKRIKSDNGYSDKQSDKDYIVYNLELRKKKLSSENQKLYFLLGAFINCGRINLGGEYVYSYPNEKYINNIIYLLKNLDEKIITISTNRDNLPGGKSVAFIPNGVLKDVLEKNPLLPQ